MRKFVLVCFCVLLSIAVVAFVGCKKGDGGDAAGKVIKDKTTGQDISKPLEMPKGGMPASPSPSGKSEPKTGVAPPGVTPPGPTAPDAAKPDAAKPDAAKPEAPK